MMMKTITNDIYVVTLIIFDNFFLKGLLINMNRPSKTEVKVRIGRANIGYVEKIPMIIP